MANGNSSHDRLAQRFEELERRVEDRSVRRDGEYAELREALADLAARLGSVEKAAEKGPGWFAVLGLIASGTSLVASLGGFAISQTVGPVKETLIQTRTDLAKVEDRQAAIMRQVAKSEGRLDEIDERVDDVDKLGSRKWVGKGD